MNQYLSKNDGLLKILIKKTRNFPPNHRLPKVCQNSIKKKNNIYSKFLKSKNENLEEFYHKNIKTYRNLLSSLLKRAEEKNSLTFSTKTLKIFKKMDR